jgi:antitoxin YefM
MHEPVTIQDIYKALRRVEEKMVTREDIDALIDSVEILSNPKTMAALHKSDQDIKQVGLRKLLQLKICLLSGESHNWIDHQKHVY